MAKISADEYVLCVGYIFSLFFYYSLQYQTGGVLLRFIELKVAESILSTITGRSTVPLNALDEVIGNFSIYFIINLFELINVPEDINETMFT